jgi:hypothetical protein
MATLPTLPALLTEAKLKVEEMLNPWLTTLIEKRHLGAVFVTATIRARGSAYTELEQGLGTSEVPFFALLEGTL